MEKLKLFKCVYYWKAVYISAMDVNKVYALGAALLDAREAEVRIHQVLPVRDDYKGYEDGRWTYVRSHSPIFERDISFVNLFQHTFTQLQSRSEKLDLLFDET